MYLRTYIQVHTYLTSEFSQTARYIKDKYKYIADLLGKFNDGSEWKAWVLCVAVVQPEEWPKTDKVFKETHNNTSLIEYVSVSFNFAHFTLSEFKQMYAGGFRV